MLPGISAANKCSYAPDDLSACRCVSLASLDHRPRTLRLCTDQKKLLGSMHHTQRCSAHAGIPDRLARQLPEMVQALIGAVYPKWQCMRLKRLGVQVKQVDSVEDGLMQEAQRFFVLTQTDNLWKEHLQVCVCARSLTRVGEGAAPPTGSQAQPGLVCRAWAAAAATCKAAKPWGDAFQRCLAAHMLTGHM